MSNIFKKTDILIPREDIDMKKWSVIACDQHTSEPEYWEALDLFVGDAPSTLRLMLPEAFLGTATGNESEAIEHTMEQYLSSGIFRTVSDSYLFTERELPSGGIRRGLIGVLDLDQYSYAPDSDSLIRATEGTVEDRLPPRVAIRKRAPIEMPHVMVFIDDKEDLLFRACSSLCREDGCETAYDFRLSAGGGRITGHRICGKSAETVDGILDRLVKNRLSAASASGKAPAVLAVGDGNHSLATAKKCGDRYALAELVNIHDPAIVFEPIHRVIFGTDVSRIEEEAKNYGFSVLSAETASEGGKILRIGSSEKDGHRSGGYGALIREAERFCTETVSRFGGSIDYIHNDDTAIRLGSGNGCAAILLPTLDKTALFDSIENSGPYPKKSFSIGHADDKRFYLECRIREAFGCKDSQ